MKKVFILTFIVLIIGLAVFLFLDKKKDKGEVFNQENNTPSQIIGKYKTLENSEGQVVVEVTPISLSSKENVRFNISLNTHSVELDKNLKDISVLFDEGGNEYKQVSFSGGTGGHHIEGELVFPKLSEDTSKVTLTIKGIAGIDRVFSWDL